MPLPTFNPLPAPSPGTRRAPQVKLHKVEFGDGYTQIVRAGINHIKQTLELRWEFVTKAQAATILAFFTERGGDKPFYYKSINDAAARKWTCASWSDEVRSDGFVSISATLEESFTNEV